MKTDPLNDWFLLGGQLYKVNDNLEFYPTGEYNFQEGVYIFPDKEGNRRTDIDVDNLEENTICCKIGE